MSADAIFDLDDAEYTLPSLKESRSVADSLVKGIIRLVDESDLPATIAEWEAEERKGPGGATQTLSARAVLVGMLVCARAHGSVLDTDIERVLYFEISPAMRAELEIASAPAGQAAYRRVNYRITRLIALFDPSDSKKNRVMLKTEAEALQAPLTDAERVTRYLRMDHLTQTILHLSYLCLPRDVRRHWKGSIAVDGTPLRQFARGTSRNSLYQSSDPDSGWYSRTASDLTLGSDWDPSGNLTPVYRPARKGKETDPIAQAYRNRKLAFWGLEATLIVMTDERTDGIAEFPKLVLGSILDTPGSRIGENATRGIRYVAERTGKTGYLAGDRAYSNSQPDKFQIPTKALGYKHVFDYRIDQLGKQETFAGAIQVEGAWYCPSMPTKLIEATRAFRLGTITYTEYQARIEDRQRFVMRVKDYDPQGRARLKCPAETSPLAGCPLKTSIREAEGKRAETVTAVSLPIKPSKADVADPPPVCTKRSVTFPVEQGAKFEQELPFGTPEHQERYALLRNTIEGFNGITKDGAHEGLADATRRRRRGLAAQSLLVAVLIFATNLRKIDSFLAKAKPDADGTRRTTRKARAKTRSQRDRDREADRHPDGFPASAAALHDE